MKTNRDNLTNFAKIDALVTEYKNTGSRETYNTLGEEIEQHINWYCKNYIDITGIDCVDHETLVSIGFGEALAKAVKSWDLTQGVHFIGRFDFILKSYIINEVKSQTLAKRAANLNENRTFNTKQDDEGNEVSVFDQIEDEKSRIEDRNMSETELYKALLENLDEDEIALLKVLMTNQGKSRGQAIAAFYGKDSYDAALRKKVSRFQASVKEILSQIN